MHTKKQQGRIEVRKKKKERPRVYYTISPQLLSDNIATLTADSYLTSFLVPNAGTVDRLAISLFSWPEDLKKLCFTVSVQNQNDTFKRQIELKQQIDLFHLGVVVEKLCLVSLVLDQIVYNEELKEGRERLYVPTQVSLVFQPARRACFVIEE